MTLPLVQAIEVYTIATFLIAGCCPPVSLPSAASHQPNELRAGRFALQSSCVDCLWIGV